jgi:PhzF family phenazine biosynthesis protein
VVLSRFKQVDVFTDTPYLGNPVAVVLDATGLDDSDMQRVANWTNLSETTFVLPAVDPRADYRVRIFTTTRELPFAGHPTLGTCHAWLPELQDPSEEQTVVQECAAGLIDIRRSHGRLAFAAPPLIRYGPVDEPLVAQIARGLGVELSEIEDAHWADNGPGWVAVLLRDAESVLALRPGAIEAFVGVAGPHPTGSECEFEVRAFFPNGAGAGEDPVTGSLNAALAKWFFETSRASGSYTVGQGSALGRRGRVHLERGEDGTIWVGGGTVTCIEGTVAL